MKYYIQRGLSEYGPYTLADLQRYIASGNIQLTDLTRNEAMQEWVPVSQVIGNIPLPQSAPPAAPPYGSTPGAGSTPSAAAGSIPTYGTPAASPASPAAGGTPTQAGGAVYGGGANPAYSGSNIPAGGTVYGAPGSPGGAPGMLPAYGASPVSGPMPPDLHWALVLLIGVFCGLFQFVWLFVEASFVKKLRPDNNSMVFFVCGIVAQVLGFVILFTVAFEAAGNPNAVGAGFVGFFYLLLLGGAALHLVGVFKMREGLLEYYNTEEPINLRLSGVMTFFFNVFYFQYHFSRIAAWKKTGYLMPQ